MRWTAPLSLVLIAVALPSCIHMKGVVLEERSDRPVRSAVLSVGRPDGVAVFDTHHVDNQGAFDFYVLPTDDDHLYLYDGAANPVLTLQRVDRTQISDKMRLRLRPAPKNADPGMDLRVPPSGSGLNY